MLWQHRYIQKLVVCKQQRSIYCGALDRLHQYTGDEALGDCLACSRRTRKHRMKAWPAPIRSLHTALSSMSTNLLLPLRLMHALAYRLVTDVTGPTFPS
jgi:hypothetical protein